MSENTVEAPTPEVTVSRLATIISRPDDSGQENLEIQISNDVYNTPDKLDSVLSVIEGAAKNLREEATNDPDGDSLVSINAGSLYDGVILESTIYSNAVEKLEEEGENNDITVMLNTTFGRHINPELPIAEGMIHAADLWEFMVQQTRGNQN